MLKSHVLQTTVTSLWQVDCLMLLVSFFTSLLPRQNQAKKVQEEIQAPHRVPPPYSLWLPGPGPWE